MAGLQPPVLQKVLQFHVHSGEFVQIVHVRNNHWCVVSTVGCESGVIHVYDSLYRSVSRETLSLIASMVYSPSSELKITMMDVEKQSNGSDCGALGIAYAFDICNGLNPCNVRFDQNKIRQHLATCLEKCQISRFPVLGGRSSVSKKPRMLELHCSCRMPEKKVLKWQSVISAMSGIIVTAWTFPVRCLVNRRFHGSVKSVPTVCEYTYKVGVIVLQANLCT